MQKQLDEAYYALLGKLQAVDFALVELTLYLDTHPLDLAAVRQFNQLSAERWELARAYEMQYGPLLQFGLSMSREPWDWADAPWPWQV
ncbi:spore coat protein CotJB [Gorillibacterium sp. sgz500922]|uniref:spore coat protein CotJB n=1 Tax=Gorillibacterium sp. sgz500922 TaxID=3446694 RepID=UPI003F676142